MVQHGLKISNSPEILRPLVPDGSELFSVHRWTAQDVSCKKNQDLLRCLLTAEERLNEQKEVAVLREVDALIFCALFC